jgi:hypothetical protein
MQHLRRRGALNREVKKVSKETLCKRVETHAPDDCLSSLEESIEVLSSMDKDGTDMKKLQQNAAEDARKVIAKPHPPALPLKIKRWLGLT